MEKKPRGNNMLFDTCRPWRSVSYPCRRARYHYCWQSLNALTGFSEGKICPETDVRTGSYKIKAYWCCTCCCGGSLPFKGLMRLMKPKQEQMAPSSHHSKAAYQWCVCNLQTYGRTLLILWPLVYNPHTVKEPVQPEEAKTC